MKEKLLIENTDRGTASYSILLDVNKEEMAEGIGKLFNRIYIAL